MLLQKEVLDIRTKVWVVRYHKSISKQEDLFVTEGIIKEIRASVREENSRLVCELFYFIKFEDSIQDFYMYDSRRVFLSLEEAEKSLT